MKILALRGGALGDFIVTLPALVALRHRWPDATIELAGNATAAELALNRGVLNRAHSQHESRWSMLYADGPLPPAFAQWLAEFDVVVSYWPDTDGALARRFPIRVGQQFIAAAAMPAHAPAAAHYCAALQPLGILAPDHFCRIEPTPIAATPVSDGRSDRTDIGRTLPTPLCSRSAPPIAIHPGSGSPKKNWPAERWIELIGQLHAPILLIVGEAEREIWSSTRWASSSLAPRVHDGSLRIASNLPLEALVNELSSCQVFLGHDSGVSHLAAACGVPCVLLFGPTDPALWAPPAAHVRVLRHGPDLAAISVDEVRQAAERAMRGALTR